MLKFTFLFASSLLASLVMAVSPQHDEYYSDDIFTAIEEAKQRTHHYNYSRYKRYNRTTSQSIEIPRLLNSEMDQQVVEGAVGATAAGDNRGNSAAEPTRQADLGRTINSEPLNQGQQNTSDNEPQKIQPGNAVHIREIHYSGQEFTGTASNIRSDVSISATVRP